MRFDEQFFNEMEDCIDWPSHYGLSGYNSDVKFLASKIILYSTYIEKHRFDKVYFYDCDNCGIAYTARRPHRSNKFCSDDCRYKGKKHKLLMNRWYEENRTPSCRVYFKECENCNRNYVARKRNQKYCSSHCRMNTRERIEARKIDWAINKEKYCVVNKRYREKNKERLHARQKELRDRKKIIIPIEEKFRRSAERSKIGISGIEMSTPGVFRVRIYVRSKPISLGSYDNLLDACCARKSAESKIIAGKVL